MSVPSAKEPKPLTSEDWKKAWKLEQERRLREYKLRLQEKNRDKRFTEEEIDQLKEVKEKVKKNEHVVLIKVLDTRNDIITFQEKEIKGNVKYIEIPKDENVKEIEKGIKRMEIEPEEDEKILKGIGNEEIEEIFKEVEHMEEEKEEEKEQEEVKSLNIENPILIEPEEFEEKYKEEEELEKQAEYGFDAVVDLKNIITSDKKEDQNKENRVDNWDKINVERLKIRFLFEKNSELCITLWNDAKLKWKKVEKIIENKRSNTWEVQKVMNKTDYEIRLITPTRMMYLERNEKWYENKRKQKEKEIETQLRINKKDLTYNYRNPERLIGIDQFISLSNIVSPETINTKIAIYNSQFINRIKDRETFVEERIQKEKDYEKAIRINDFMNHLMYIGRKEAEEEYQEYKTLRDKFDTIFSRLNLPYLIEDFDTVDKVKEILLPIFGEEKLKEMEQFIIKYFDLKSLYKQTLEKDLELDELPNQEEIKDWFEHGEEKINKAKYLPLEYDRTANGEFNKIKMNPFKLVIYTDRIKPGRKDIYDDRKVRIGMFFEDIEQYEQITNLFNNKLENIIIKVTEQKKKDQEYLKEYFEKEKKWKEEQSKKEEEQKEE